MKSEELLHEVQGVVNCAAELVNASQEALHSPHEVYAVLKENFEGAREKLRQTKLFIQDFWEHVKEGNAAYYAESLMTTRDCAIECTVEAIRIAMTPRTQSIVSKKQINRGKYERCQPENRG